jgi:hypothetical protein
MGTIARTRLSFTIVFLPEPKVLKNFMFGLDFSTILNEMTFKQWKDDTIIMVVISNIPIIPIEFMKFEEYHQMKKSYSNLMK